MSGTEAISALAPLLGGLGGLGGSKTKVTQTASSLSSLALNIVNMTGGTNSGETGGATNVSPVTSTSPSDSRSPAYGAFPDTSYSEAPLTAVTPTGGLFDNPAILAGGALLVGLGVLAAFTKKGR